MDDHFEKCAGRPRVCPLPPHNLRYLRPLLPCLPEVGHSCWKITVCGREKAKEVFERSGVGQGFAVGPEHGLRSIPGRLRGKSATLLLCPPGANFCARVAAVQSSLRDEHIAEGASRVGAVALVKDHHCVMRMTVHRVDPEVCPDRCPALAPSTGKVTAWSALGNETRYVLGAASRGASQATLWLMPC